MTSLYNIRVYTPSNILEALEMLHTREGRVKPVAGGTDLIIQMRSGVVPRMDLLNIYGLRELQYIKLENGLVRIGALTTFTEIANSHVIRTYARMLGQAAETIGSVQIMNKATLGGNLVNASPAADSLPPLYVLGANVRLSRIGGDRVLPIEKFYLGYKKMDMMGDEMLTEVSFPPMDGRDEGAFFKHGLRLGDAISVVNGAVKVRKSGGVWEDVRVALGAVAPTVARARRCEEILRGSKPTDELLWRAASSVVEDISPIDDVRASASYRREMAINFVYMTLREIFERG